MAGNSSLAAGADSAALEPWRELFRGRDIYDVICKAILVAATDSPHEFRRRRDGIVEQIYTMPAAVPALQENAGGEGSGSALLVSEKGSKVGSCSCTVELPEQYKDDGGGGEGIATQQDDGEIGMDVWLQTLADEIDAETQEINEVLRIKEILLNHHEQPADILFDSLRRLQLMQLTVDKIKSTEIGAVVAALSKHKVHKIRMLVRDIIK
ncbi:hypothetical protein BS78_03G123800 [Paspalum vaginatum]|nr:hypothetical protein BS78_03G123800 [Paspalum vaginatum]